MSERTASHRFDVVKKKKGQLGDRGARGLYVGWITTAPLPAGRQQSKGQEVILKSTH